MRIPVEVRKAVNDANKKVINALARLAIAKITEKNAVAVGFYYGGLVREQDVHDGSRHIKILPVMVMKGSERVASKYAMAFDVNSIALDSVIEMKVPKDKGGLFAGFGKWKIKSMCQRLGLKDIKIVEEA